jgi:hypothetical protein
MSKTRIFAILAFVLAACSGGGTYHPPIHLDMGTSEDGSTMKADMTMGAADLTMTGCPGSEVKCNGVCTDTSSDPNNCGGCNRPCAGTCTNSQCMTSNLTGCNGLIACVNNCMDQTCQMNCLNNTTAMGKQLFQAALTCLENACPSMMMGQVCFAPPPNAPCDTCYMQAQAMGGACFNQVQSCLNNMP